LPITGAATLNSLGAKAEVAHLLVTRSPAFALRAFFGAENDLALRNNGLAASATNPRAYNKQTVLAVAQLFTPYLSFTLEIVSLFR
jgi:hypothetical protein